MLRWCVCLGLVGLVVVLVLWFVFFVLVVFGLLCCFRFAGWRFWLWLVGFPAVVWCVGLTVLGFGCWGLLVAVCFGGFGDF